MAIEPGINITDHVLGLLKASSLFIKTDATKVFGPSKKYTPSIRAGQSFASTGAKAFYSAVKVSPNILNCKYYASSGTKVFLDGKKIYVSSRAKRAGDDTKHLILGLHLDFEGDPVRGYAPLGVKFHNYCGGPIESFYWEFGDGGKSNEKSPYHIYELPGLYSVTIYVYIGTQFWKLRKRYYIKVLPRGLRVSRTNKSWRLGFNENQGFGFSENTGASWPFPESDTGTLLVYDENEQQRQLVFSNEDGRWYFVNTRDGPSLTKYWKDGVAVAGTGGTEVLPIVTFPEDKGTHEHYFLRHLESHAYIRPIKEADGLPAGLELKLEVLKDGEPVTAYASSEDIPVTGDIKFDKVVEAHRLQMRLSANMGNHRIAGRQQYYVAIDKAESGLNKTMSEDTYQKTVTPSVLWASQFNGRIINRITGADIIASPTLIAGPDDRTEAFETSETTTFGTVALSSGCIMLWYQGTPTVKIGADTISITDYDTVGDWKLGYADAVTKTGALTITAGKLFDLRVFSSAVATATIKKYYYDDVNANSGNIVLPR